MKRQLFLLPLLLLLAACGGEEVHERQFFAMDTLMTVTAHGHGAEEGVSAAVERINALEGLLSRTREGGEVAALNAAGRAEISADAARVLALSKLWSEKTGGAFDVTIAPVSAAWGFGGAGDYRVPAAEELAALLPLADSAALTVGDDFAALERPGMAVDLGGVAKGYAAGEAARVLRDHGVESALLDLGGSVTLVGSKEDGSPWRVAVQDPADSGAVVGVLSLTDCSAVTSGGYQRYFERDGAVYHHILDPRTGYPANSGLLSATVVCADPTLADILSTAVFVMGEEAALDLWRAEGGFELALVTGDGRLVVTAGLAGRFSQKPGTGYSLEYAQ